MTEKFETMKQYLQDVECCASTYDDKSFTVWEYNTFENALYKYGIQESEMPTEDKQEIVDTIQKKFKFAEVGLSEDDGYYIDFDFTLLKNDVNCNIVYICNAIHCFHDTFHEEIRKYMSKVKAVA